jgi:hypothetical protein
LSELGTTFLLAIYGAAGTTVSLIWNFLDRRKKITERRKIFVRFGIPIIHRGVPNVEEFYIFPLCIMNLGREPVIVTNVEMRRKNGKFSPGAYNEPGAMLGIYGERMLPRRLEPGDTLTLEQFTAAAFHDCPEEIVVSDADNREYKMSPQHLKQEFESIKRYLKKPV